MCLLLTEGTTLGRQTGQGDLEVDTDHVGAGKGEHIARDVALAGRSKAGDVCDTSGVVALDSSITVLASNWGGVRLGNDSSGQGSNGCSDLHGGQHA